MGMMTTSDLTPQPGSRVLTPTADSTLVEVLSYYDGPLEGVFSTAGIDWHAECRVGHIEETQVWLYRPLVAGGSDQLLAELAAADPARVHDVLVAPYIADGPVVVARVSFGVIESSVTVLDVDLVDTVIDAVATTWI